MKTFEILRCFKTKPTGVPQIQHLTVRIVRCWKVRLDFHAAHNTSISTRLRKRDTTDHSTQGCNQLIFFPEGVKMIATCTNN